MLAGTMHSSLFFVLFLLPWSALYYFTERLSESSQKTPFLITKFTGILTLLNVTSPNCHTNRAKMALLQRALDLLEAC